MNSANLQQCKWFILKIARLHKEIADKFSRIAPSQHAMPVSSSYRSTRSKIVLDLTRAVFGRAAETRTRTMEALKFVSVRSSCLSAA
jgi:hypothetical protein